VARVEVEEVEMVGRNRNVAIVGAAMLLVALGGGTLAWLRRRHRNDTL
jgi:hypothetical protein